MAFVLGAGFTKAFFPSAPLLVDHYPISPLIELADNRSLPFAKRILKLAIVDEEGRVDIEQLLTRAEQGMPFDAEHATPLDMPFLRSQVKKMLMERLSHIGQRPEHEELFSEFVTVCMENHATCITFNYDDTLDAGLMRYNLPTLRGPADAGKGHWHPDGGYGFFVPPASQVIYHGSNYKDATDVVLLKLHGSVNWRVRKGEFTPYSIDALLHSESWFVDPELEKLHVARARSAGQVLSRCRLHSPTSRVGAIHSSTGPRQDGPHHAAGYPARMVVSIRGLNHRRASDFHRIFTSHDRLRRPFSDLRSATGFGPELYHRRRSGDGGAEKAQTHGAL